MKLIPEWREVCKRAHSMHLVYVVIILQMAYAGWSVWAYGALPWQAVVNAILAGLVGLFRNIDQGGIK